ncbi:hypothetical protein B0H13DRAFT_1470064, partial [Mycena leptocephala]
SDQAPKPFNLLDYHRPKRRKPDDARISPLGIESKRYLRNLFAYRPQEQKITYHRSRPEAFLVALFVGRLGEL